MSTEFDADTVSAPRLVVMKRGDGGYGFNLHGERNVQAGQTISAVDDGSEAQKAGLRVGDKVVEVNGINVEKMSHGDVVKRIKMNEKEVSMLVIDHITEAYLKQEGRPITADMANLMTVYQFKHVVTEPEPEPEPAQPAVVVEDSVPEVQESSAVETTPTPTDESSAVNDSTANEVDSAEVANEATTPEEVKQLNEVLDKEDEPSPEPAPEPVPEPVPESTPVLNNGTVSHPEPAPQPTPVAPPPTQHAPLPSRPTSKPLRSTIKQQKAESWDDKYKKFQNL